MRGALLLTLLVACGHDDTVAKRREPTREPMRDDSEPLHAMLRDRDAAANVESVRVDLADGSRDARYIVRLKTTAKKSEYRAPFPGTLAGELYDANIAWTVAPPDAFRRE